MTIESCVPTWIRGERGNLVWILLTAGAVAGCNSPPPPPLLASTEASEVVQHYCDALLRQDWGSAYAALHPDSRARVSAEQFARLAAKYRDGLGFEPEPAHVRFCQEQGSRAVAHIVWKGRKATREGFYKDAIVLRQMQSGWGVVLPVNFGRGRQR